MRSLIARHRFAAGFLLGIFCCAALGIAAAGCVVAFGWFDVAALSPHSRIAAWAIHTTMQHAVRNAARSDSPSGGASPEQIRRGFQEYERDCVVCHGGPGVDRARWVRGLNPTPPFLLDAAQRWSPGQLRYIISHGIKMTAMPAWALSRSDRDISDLVAFLNALPGLSPAEYAALRKRRIADQQRAGRPGRPDQ